MAVNGDLVFRVASLSKRFTALAVMKLRDEGRLSLDAPVVELVFELELIVLQIAVFRLS